VPAVDPEKIRKEAKAAYDLALLYKKIGLKNEFTKELQRAERLYAELAQESAEAAGRLSEIRVALGRNSTTMSTEKSKPAIRKPAAKQEEVKAKPAPAKPTPKKPTAKKKESATKSQKDTKKKVSFV
jgi:hypothetical protein